MKIKRIALFLLPVAAAILEALPWGVALYFANPEGEPWRYTYSYFDLTPFGYADLAPFIVAILTCVLALLGLIIMFKQTKGLKTAVIVMAGAATVLSLVPLAIFGLTYLTPIGAAVTILLAADFILAW